MKRKDLKVLFKKYHDRTCTEEEKALLEAWYLQYNEEYDNPFSFEQINAIKKRISRELPGNHTAFLNIAIRLLIAASVIGFLFAITIKYLFPTSTVTMAAVTHDISPGTNKAILTIANGKKINLTNTVNGLLTAQPGTFINQSGAGQIVYQPHQQSLEASNSITNNITTPNGGQWQILLPDGTKVWLNSATSFTYPITFSGLKERIVRLSGEAYFEVAKDKAHPFIVKTDQQEVRVLGTHFNIKSYADEPTEKTTLLEGSIKVWMANRRVFKLLTPGQQSVLSDNKLIVTYADTEEAVAWKNGYFRFNDENIQSIMRKLSRWYDVQVQYEGKISMEGLNGKVSRFKNISQVLKALEATKTVHFKMEGRRVVVMN